MRTRMAVIVGITLGVGWLGSVGAEEPKTEKVPPKKLLFLGDSITRAGGYVRIIAAGLAKQDPANPPRVINHGRSSETVSDLSEAYHPGRRPCVLARLDKELAAKPDWVVACYGINCGIYHPFSEKRFAAYQAGIENLIKKVHASGSRLILLTAPPYAYAGPPLPEGTDAAARKELLAKANAAAAAAAEKDPKKFGYRTPYPYYDQVMARYAEWLLTLNGRKDVWVIDLREPMLPQIKKTHGRDPIHPNGFGHAVMAEAFLKQWAAIQAQPGGRTIPWDIPALCKTPKVHPAEKRPAKGMRAFFYEGAEYKGKVTRVFAYYAAPEGKPPAGGWPAVVCAHGGGGTAYPEWVKKWNGHGYAAIAMDLEGHLPGGKSHHVEGNFPTGQGHKNAGPARIDWFGDRALGDKEQWFYHAVADVVRANSLLRSFKEINPKKIGLTGISWGGTVVSTVAGVDSRFAFVIPVYGAGFIHKSDNPGLSQWFPPKNMTQKQFQDYRRKWDPAAHLPHAKMPMLFVSSVADPVFQVDIFSKSARAAGGPSTLCLRPWMIHAHGSGWDDAGEIYNFADSIVKDGPPLPKLGRPEVNPETRIVHTKYTAGFTEAWVYFTTAGGAFKGRKWHFIQCNLGKGELVSRKPLGKETTAFLVYGFKVGQGGHRSNHSASELVVVKTP